jgi:hypothetical protein
VPIRRPVLFVLYDLLNDIGHLNRCDLTQLLATLTLNVATLPGRNGIVLPVMSFSIATPLLAAYLYVAQSLGGSLNIPSSLRA